MDIGPEIYQRLMDAETALQAEILESIKFVLMDQCNEYQGKIIDAGSWLEPEQYLIEEFFERTLEDAWQRITDYQQDPVLTEQERELYKEYCIDRAHDDEYHAGMFTGLLSCNGSHLVVIAQRTGGAWDCEAEFCGVYSDLETGIRSIAGPTGYLDFR